MTTAKRARSLVSTLFIRVVILLAGTIAAIGATAYWIAKHRIDDVYDSELITGTKLLHTLSKEELEQQAEDLREGELVGKPGAPLSEEDIETFNTYARWRMFRIWRGSQLIARSVNGPAQVAMPNAAGFVDLAEGTDTWRLYVLPLKDVNMSIVVGEPLSVRYAVINEFALTLTVPLLLLIPASAGLIWLTLLDGLGALRRLAVALHSKSGSNLSPLDSTQWPRDLAGTITAINGLLARLDSSFRQTLRFTDHAAHQLRTPLAGLRLNAHLIEAEKDPAEQRAIALRIHEGAERAAALVEQLLTLAHLDSGAFAKPPSEVAAVAKTVLAELAPVAAAKDVALALSAQPEVVVRADELRLRMILSNLVDNAIKHSPSGREVAVEIARESDPDGSKMVRLVVTDHGLGIPPDERQRVFERFYRADSSQPGVGLGLSIVAEAVAQIGGSITLETPDWGNGLRAVVRLPAA